MSIPVACITKCKVGIGPAAIGEEGRAKIPINWHMYVFLLVYCPDIVSNQPWMEDTNLPCQPWYVVAVGITVGR